MNVTHNKIPASHYEEDGEILDLPARRQWIVICYEHGGIGEGIYVPLEMLESDYDRMDTAQFAEFLVVQCEQMKLEFAHHGCEHDFPFTRMVSSVYG